MNPRPLVSVVLAFLLAFGLQACADNPLTIAETPNQRAGAISASFNVLLESATEILEDRSVPNSVAEPINEARLAATPIVDELEDALLAYEVELARFRQGETTEERIEIVALNLERWLLDAEAAFVNLADAVAGAR